MIKYPIYTNYFTHSEYFTITSVLNEYPDQISGSFELFQNYPNPFNPSTVINFQIPEAGFVTLKVYDILGKEVKTLVNENKHVGSYNIRFDASDLASGFYIYQIRINSYISSKKMLLIK
ncbi:MAG TPA: T9SS type A sorting domain-containing protein [Ignavibacteriaceae bacterium]|nr:T9SS type A sorting domain-containing protein [Ignavibacteriaceae bacterium]